MEDSIVITPDLDWSQIQISDEPPEHVTIIEEGGPPGPPGPTGPPGPVGMTGQGVLVLNANDPVPPGTPDNTVIFRKEP